MSEILFLDRRPTDGYNSFHSIIVWIFWTVGFILQQKKRNTYALVYMHECLGLVFLFKLQLHNQNNITKMNWVYAIAKCEQYVPRNCLEWLAFHLDFFGVFISCLCFFLLLRMQIININTDRNLRIKMQISLSLATDRLIVLDFLQQTKS